MKKSIHEGKDYVLKLSVFAFCLFFLSSAVYALLPGPIFFADAPAPTADTVFGQPDFLRNTSGSAITSFEDPLDVVFDDTGVMYVSDFTNNRILVFVNQADTIPDMIIGGSLGQSADSLNEPSGLAIFNGSETTILFVADKSNNRVLGYIVRQPGTSFLADTTATYVFGQTGFGLRTLATSLNGMKNPTGLAILDTGSTHLSLLVTDSLNNRVLRFDILKTLFGGANSLMDTTPDELWGQSGFTTSNSGTDTDSLNSPRGVAITQDRIYIADNTNNRVLIESLTDADTLFDAVYGQPDFFRNTATFTQTGLSGPNQVTLNQVRNTLVVSDGNNRLMFYADTMGVDTKGYTVVGDTDFENPAQLAISNPSAKSLSGPNGIVFQDSRTIWVVDAGNNRVLRFDGFVSPIAENQTLPVFTIADPADTKSTINAPIATTDRFLQINLNGGSITSGVLSASVDSVGTGANYSETTQLMDSKDTLAIFVWTNQSKPSMFVGLRSDTTSFNSNFLPTGVTDNALGRTTFGASVVMIEFANDSGDILGDSVTTKNIGDTFAYSLTYYLSETTTRGYKSLGIDTKVGSKEFAFYFADTYGGFWAQDASVSVTVEAGTGGGIIVRVSGLTKDLPGGLGGIAGIVAVGSSSDGGVCLIERAGAPTWMLPELRTFRDLACGSFFGRLIVSCYYSISNWFS